VQHKGSLVAAAPVPAASPAHVLKLYLADTRQLFDSMDPAPFHERDVDSKAAAYIVDWAREAPAAVPLGLEVHLGRRSNGVDEAAMLTAAVDEHFRRCALATRRQLRELFRVGRISLVIGLGFVGLVVLISEWISKLIGSGGYSALITESLGIGAAVALWRPMEIFLYDWWPIRAEARLFERLAAMPVTLLGADAPVERAA